jgi:uncharacterized membrane protein
MLVEKKMRPAVFGCCAAVIWLLVLDSIWLFLGGAKEAFEDLANDIGSIEPWRHWQSGLFALAAYGLLAAVVCNTVLSERAPVEAAARGAFLGLVIYGVFDLTNLVVFGRGYSASLAFSDVFWGTCLIGSSAFVGALVAEGVR